MARTQAVYYRDPNGREPVDDFIRRLPSKRATKIDEYVEEYLNDRPPAAPPPEFPISSQVDGELRELRIRFGNTRYRLLYQRSANLIVLLHAIEKHTGATRGPTSSWRTSGGGTSYGGWTPSLAFRRVRPVKTRRHRADHGLDGIYQNR